MRSGEQIIATSSLSASGGTGLVAVLTEYHDPITIALMILFGCVGWYYKYKDDKRKEREPK